MALTEAQKTEAQAMFAKGYSTSQVFRHFGAQSIGKESEIDIEESAIKSAETKPALKPISQKITDIFGLGGAVQTFGDTIARTKLGANLTTSPEAKAANQLAGISNVESNRAGIEAPTGKEQAGALLQTGSTLAGVALAPAKLPVQMAVGAGLGYMYDVGGDLVDGASTKDTLTPGVGTAVGALLPPALAGVGRFFKGAGTQVAQEGVDAMIPNAPASNAITAPAQTLDVATPGVQTSGTNAGSAVEQTVSDVVESAKRVKTRITEKAQEQTTKAQRLRTAPSNVREAIKVGLDDPMIDFATNADQVTKDAARKMVTMAEAPKKMGTNPRPTQVAEDAAIDQYKTVVKAKKDIGTQIGEISEQFPTLKSIDVVPTQDNLLKVMENNGLSLNLDGKIVAPDNLKITDEQLDVINKLFDKVTKQNKVSAKNLHELDQWFSSTQRKSRMVDKIDDVYVTVPTPDGKTKEVNIFKVFRDAFGQRLDEVAPDNLRALNKQYRQYSNFLEDVEGKLVSNPEFSDLVGKDGDAFAEAGLRRIFGEGKGAAEREAIYNALDTVSRELGYKGARADDLYAFGEALKALYPETVQKTSFRGQIGAGIMDKLGTIIDVGKVAPQDKQRALKILLEMPTE